jgi:hypothetical protein
MGPITEYQRKNSNIDFLETLYKDASIDALRGIPKFYTIPLLPITIQTTDIFHSREKKGRQLESQKIPVQLELTFKNILNFCRIIFYFVVTERRNKCCGATPSLCGSGSGPKKFMRLHLRLLGKKKICKS